MGTGYMWVRSCITHTHLSNTYTVRPSLNISSCAQIPATFQQFLISLRMDRNFSVGTRKDLPTYYSTRVICRRLPSKELTNYAFNVLHIINQNLNCNQLENCAFTEQLRSLFSLFSSNLHEIWLWIGQSKACKRTAEVFEFEQNIASSLLGLPKVYKIKIGEIMPQVYLLVN